MTLAESTPGESLAWTAEAFADVGSVKLAYQTLGDPADPAMLMIMGLGSQMIFWPQGLCEMFAERGYFLIRFDNRDAGRSTQFEGTPSLTEILGGDPRSAPYLLDDMAEDAAGLLDYLGVKAAHVVGVSQGGMIAQKLAVRRPDRVLSLASLMSSTGARGVGAPNEKGMKALMWRPAADREGYIEDFVAARRLIGSTGFEVDGAVTRELAGRAFERGRSPEGTLRQLSAILASGDRTEELKRLRVPTVVFHGDKDPLIGVSGGEATAAAIPGAELVVIPGLGHDLPREVWPRIVEAVTGNIERAGKAPANAGSGAVAPTSQR